MNQCDDAVPADLHVCTSRCRDNFHVETVLEPRGFLDSEQAVLVAHYAESYRQRGGGRVLAVRRALWLGLDAQTDGVAVIFAKF